MLTDILGVIIAFIAVIALLSVLVTSLSQMTQAVFRLRSRNLKVGIEKLLMTWREVARRKSEVPDREATRQARRDAATILNAANLAPIGRAGDPNSWFRWLIGPRVSWIEAEDLTEAIRREGVDVLDPTGSASTRDGSGRGSSGSEPGADAQEPAPLSDEQIRTDFRKLSPALQKRFLRTMRLWGLAWALLVAFAFQVSAPELMSTLAAEADRREAVLGGVDDTLASMEGGAGYANVRDDALEALRVRHPDLAERIDGAGSAGESRADMMAELATALEGAPDGDSVVNEYGGLLDQLAAGQPGRAGQTSERLASFGIELWPDGLGYYYDAGGIRVDAVIGVLITAILLSLGAPFWFEQLRNSIRFRDLLAGTSPGTGGASNPDEDS